MSDTTHFVKGLSFAEENVLPLEEFELHIEAVICDQAQQRQEPQGPNNTVLSTYGLHKIAGGKKIHEVRMDPGRNTDLLARIRPVLLETVSGKYALQDYGLLATEVSELWAEGNPQGLDSVVGIGVRSRWKLVGTQRQELALHVGVNLEPHSREVGYASEEVLMPLAIVNDARGEAVFEQYDHFMNNTVERMLAVSSKQKYFSPEIMQRIRRYPLPPLVYTVAQSQLQHPKVGRSYRGFKIASVKSLTDYLDRLRA